MSYEVDYTQEGMRGVFRLKTKRGVKERIRRLGLDTYAIVRCPDYATFNPLFYETIEEHDHSHWSELAKVEGRKSLNQ